MDEGCYFLSRPSEKRERLFMLGLLVSKRTTSALQIDLSERLVWY